LPSGSSLRLGVDLGGTKIEIIALADDGRELARRRIATPQGDYSATLRAIAGLVDHVENELGRRGTLGIGIPGAESLATGLIKNANSTCLIGQPLKHDLQTLLQREIRLANDANCFALSEAVDGSGRDASIVFAVILGTGVGGGIAINRQVLTGANAIAGEWGHNPLPLPQADDLPLPPCYCGRTGCIETYLAGPALAADHLKHTSQQLDSVSIEARAAAGDPACEATLRRYECRLGRALAGVINILDPQVIVLGGGLSKMTRLYRNLPDCCGPHVFSDDFRTQILPPVHGDSSGVRGAAWLWD
jgi:fructokinase